LWSVVLLPKLVSKRSTQNPNLCKDKARDSFKPRKQEFLELMLKYQRVISERDSGKKLGNQFLLSRPLFYAFESHQLLLSVTSLSDFVESYNEECKRVSTEEQTLRSDLSTKFQEAINVVELSHKQP
ncbi:hypothetical protein HID58_054179, partial [Brassica napus]